MSVSRRGESLMLTEIEKIELTEYVRPSAQRKRLDELGIPYITGKTGSPLVMRSILKRWFAPRNYNSSHQEPDFSHFME